MTDKEFETESQVITPDAEQLINTALMQLKGKELTDAGLAQLEAQYGALTIAGPNDADGYKTVSAGIAVLRKYRTSVEARRKELIAPALKWQRDVNEEAKRITAKIVTIEDHLKAEKDKVDKAAELRLKYRASALFELGATFNGQAYVLYEPLLVGTIPPGVTQEQLNLQNDDQFNATMAMFKNYAAAAKKAQEDDAARRKAEAEELERLRKLAAEVQPQASQQTTVNPQPAAQIPMQAARPNPFTESHATQPAPTGIPAPQPQAPGHNQQVGSNSPQYISGFNAAITLALAEIDNPNNKTRGELKAAIKSLKP